LWIDCALLLTALVTAPALPAQVTFYSGATARADWLAAAGGTPAVLNFEGYANDTVSNTGALATQAAAAWVVFRPFLNGLYPTVRTGDGGIGADGSNWLGNNLSQGFAATDAISWTFNQSVRSFGFYDVGTDDGFEVTIYTTGATSLGTFLTAETPGTPFFWGFVVNQDIGRVDIKPRVGFGNGYIGIDGLAVVAIPEPPAVASVLGAGALWCAWRRRSRLPS
jgi:hypothetical protein